MTTWRFEPFRSWAVDSEQSIMNVKKHLMAKKLISQHFSHCRLHFWTNCLKVSVSYQTYFPNFLCFVLVVGFSHFPVPLPLLFLCWSFHFLCGLLSDGAAYALGRLNRDCWWVFACLQKKKRKLLTKGWFRWSRKIWGYNLLGPLVSANLPWKRELKVGEFWSKHRKKKKRIGRYNSMESFFIPTKTFFRVKR